MVKAQLEAIDEAKAQLSDEELDQLDFSLYTEAASALGGLAKPMLTDSTKKISVRMNAKNGKSTDSVSDGVSTAYGTTHTLTVTPQTGRYVIAGYFAGTDYYKTNPAKYQYSKMTLHKISEADSQTGAVQYQFTATEVIPISNDPNYDYICLYFHCAKLPTLLWTLGNISGEATAPSTDGNKAAIPYVSQKELCGDPNEYTGYYSLADKKDRPYLDWQVISITDKEGNTAGGTVAFDNNHLTYTPTANEAGKTVTITIRPKLGYVEEANTPLSFEIEVKKPVVEQSEFNVTMVIDGYGNAVARPNSAKEGEEIQLTAIPDRGHHFKEWQATSGNIRITNDKFTMPAGNVTVKAIFEADTYTVKLHANGGTIASGQDVTSYTYGTGAALPTADDITYTGHTFKGWYDNEGLTGDPVTAIGGTETGNKEYWAKWEANTYPVTLNTNGGTINSGKVTSYTYGVGATLPTDVTRTGYTFKGWYDNENLTGSPVTAIGGTETGNKEYWAKWEINQYTITVKPENGKADITITQDYGTPITAPADPTREGYTFMGWDTEIPTTMPAENITLKAKWKDIEKPTGEIVIGTNKWQEFLNKITFGLFFKDTQTVTINAADNSGTVFVSYLVTDQDLSEAELQSLVFSGYEEPFRIDPNGEYIVYAMLVDESLNITYLRSDRVTLDNVQPVIGGIENGKTYCEAQTVTIDEKYVDTVTVNGTEVTLDENNSFVLSPADGEQKIIVTDKAGNTAEMTVTVNDGHTGGTATCTERAVCEICGKAYGDLDGNHHANLKHIDAKAATKTAGGNIEYWYCEDCDKYFADAAAIKEIKQADTVTAKLSGAAKSPQTGGDSGVVTVLLLSGGAFICLVSRRKKRTHTV